MYTIDDQKEDLYEEEYESSKWDNYKGLIFKIIIIILCIVVLILLIKALKNNRNETNDSAIHSANTEKIRLAAEQYYFIKNNKDKISYVNVSELKNEGLVTDIVDANNKVCSESKTGVNLDNEIDAYKMTIKYSCSTNDKDEIFYYHKNTLACLNCSGKTYMDGKTVVIDDDNNKEPEKEESIYNCYEWSNWTKNRVYDSDLTERVKTLVLGVKYGKKTVYSDWSEYSITPIVKTDGIEIETKTVNEEVWSENKTSTNVDKSNPNIRIISQDTVTETTNRCTDGYVVDNICYSKSSEVGNLSYAEYNSGNYQIKNEYCEGIKSIKNSDGKYVLTYLNCEYNKKIGEAKKTSSYTLYTYQEKELKDVTYYRYRTVDTLSEPDKYTDIKYEEKDLPSGYVKVDGSEETYYSYKETYCVK